MTMEESGLSYFDFRDIVIIIIIEISLLILNINDIYYKIGFKRIVGGKRVTATSVIICLLCFIAGGFSVYLVQEYILNCEKTSGEYCVNRKNCKHIFSRDIIYISIFALICIVILITKALGNTNNTIFINQLSFAGMVSSIILSVLAIIVTLIGETKSDSAKDNLIKASNTIETSTKLLESYINTIDQNSLKQLDEKINATQNLLGDAINNLKEVQKSAERAADMATRTHDMYITGISKDNVEVKMLPLSKSKNNKFLSDNQKEEKEGAEYNGKN